MAKNETDKALENLSVLLRSAAGGDRFSEQALQILTNMQTTQAQNLRLQIALLDTDIKLKSLAIKK